MSRQRTDFRFFDPLRVRWAEVDMQKIVFNGHYLMYFDTAVAGYWRALALPYHDAMELLQGDLYVRKATLEYEASARYDDVCQVGVRTARIGTSSMLIEAAVFRQAQRLVHGELLYVFADPRTQTSRPVPQPLRDVLLGFEQGEPVLQVQEADWAAVAEPVRRLRRAVFVEEQGLPDALVEDRADAAARHVVLRNRLDMVVAAGRVAPGAETADRTARLARLCVSAPLRHGGYGAQLLHGLLTAAKGRGAAGAVLDARAGTEGFYARAGFEPAGPVFEEAGVVHQPMRRAL
jgi:YbgC/YbaW family acyl-CoA thioester hydrolase